MQGGLLDMVYYVIGVIPLIKQLKAAYPNVPQPWSAEYSGAMCTYDKCSYILIL